MKLRLIFCIFNCWMTDNVTKPRLLRGKCLYTETVCCSVVSKLWYTIHDKILHFYIYACGSTGYVIVKENVCTFCFAVLFRSLVSGKLNFAHDNKNGKLHFFFRQKNNCKCRPCYLELKWCSGPFFNARNILQCKRSEIFLLAAYTHAYKICYLATLFCPNSNGQRYFFSLFRCYTEHRCAHSFISGWSNQIYNPVHVVPSK